MRIVKPSIEMMDGLDYRAVLEKIERAGRVCYKSEDKITEDSAERFVRGIIKSGHESVIEHVSLSVKVICDRGVSHEIVRHRIASYSQESTRYCNYGSEKFSNQISCIDVATGFHYDLTNEADRKKYDIWNRAMEAAEKYYFEMVQAGAKPEEARSILPNSLKTEIVMTMNLREWRHFIRLRGSKAAHPQIREIADMICKEFVERYPVFFEDIVKAEVKKPAAVTTDDVVSLLNQEREAHLSEIEELEEELERIRDVKDQLFETNFKLTAQLRALGIEVDDAQEENGEA